MIEEVGPKHIFKACSWSVLQTDKNWCLKPKPSLKIGSVNEAFFFCYWLRPKNPKFFFFRNKTFLFFKIESWNFHHLFEKEFRETSQNFNSLSSFRQFLFPFFLSVVWLSEVRYHECFFKHMLKVSAIYLEKQKCFIPKKKNF